MRSNYPGSANINSILFLGLCLVLTVLFPMVSRAQVPEKPPKPIIITVSALQHLDFGKIVATGTYGYVTVPPIGAPSTFGDVYLLNLTTPGLIEVESQPGTLITIGFPVNVTMLGGTPAGSLNLTDFTSDHSPSFISTSTSTFVYFGGKLEVRTIVSDNPPGDYSGNILVTFTQIHQ
jgi:hypothetical protein